MHIRLSEIIVVLFVAIWVIQPKKWMKPVRALSRRRLQCQSLFKKSKTGLIQPLGDRPYSFSSPPVRLLNAYKWRDEIQE